MTSNRRPGDPPEGQANTRSDPRTVLSLEIDVEVAGERRRLKLVSRDISAGGIFLRTDSPAPVFKRVKLFMAQPDGAQLVLAGEVVRSLSPEAARSKGQPAGMAVAFDEGSRTKAKLLASLLDSMHMGGGRTQEGTTTPAKVAAPAAPLPESKPEKLGKDKADLLLEALGSLLVEDGAAEEKAKEAAEPEPARPVLAANEVSAKAPPPPPPQAPARVEASSARPAAEPGSTALLEALRQALQDYRQSLRGSTHYDVLLLERQASAAQVKQAFVGLVQRLKPRLPSSQIPADLAKGLAVALDRIKKAADTLSNPERRKAYDYLLQGHDGG